VIPASPHWAKVTIIGHSETNDDPKNSGVNYDRSIVSLIEFIAAIHCESEKDWAVATLAKEIVMSR